MTMCSWVVIGLPGGANVRTLGRRMNVEPADNPDFQEMLATGMDEIGSVG
jgi:hypothetical protein